MKRGPWQAAALGVAAFLVGCAASVPPRGTPQGLGPDPHRIGPLTILIRPQPEVDRLCRLRYPSVPPNRRIDGCYAPEGETIITVADPYVLLHELRHHFEGAWHSNEWTAPAATR